MFSSTWLRIGGGLLAAVTFLQLEVSLPHSVHVAAAAVAVFLTYVLGKADEKEGKKDEVNL